MKKILIIIFGCFIGIAIAHAQVATNQQIQLLEYTMNAALAQASTDQVDIGLDQSDIAAKSADYNLQIQAAQSANAYIQAWEESQSNTVVGNATDEEGTVNQI